jgi:hypothetical protein
MSFLALANRPELTRLDAAILLRTIRKPPLGVSPPHRLAGALFHYGATTHFWHGRSEPGGAAPHSAYLRSVLRWDWRSVRCRCTSVSLRYASPDGTLVEHEYRAVLLGTQEGRC